MGRLKCDHIKRLKTLSSFYWAYFFCFQAKQGLKMLVEAGMEKINFSGGEPFLHQVSISSTFSYKFFVRKLFWQLLLVTFWLWEKNSYEKRARLMLMKLTTGWKVLGRTGAILQRRSGKEPLLLWTVSDVVEWNYFNISEILWIFVFEKISNALFCISYIFYIFKNFPFIL